MSNLFRLATFIAVCYSSLGDHGLPAIVQRTLDAPPVMTSLEDYLEGNDECLRTSRYFRPQNGFVCKNLGLCYQYHCKRVARRCGSCSGGKGPCPDYDITNSSDANINLNSKKKRRRKRKRRMAGSAWSKILTLSRNRRDLENGNPTNSFSKIVRPPVYIENIGNAIVHLQAGGTNCTGFVTTVKQESNSYVIMTAAQCLVRYDVHCEVGIVILLFVAFSLTWFCRIRTNGDGKIGRQMIPLRVLGIPIWM